MGTTFWGQSISRSGESWMSVYVSATARKCEIYCTRKGCSCAVNPKDLPLRRGVRWRGCLPATARRSRVLPVSDADARIVKRLSGVRRDGRWSRGTHLRNGGRWWQSRRLLRWIDCKGATGARRVASRGPTRIAWDGTHPRQVEETVPQKELALQLNGKVLIGLQRWHHLGDDDD